MPTFAPHSPARVMDGGSLPETPTLQFKPTRKQVSRACDWCRAKRIKCDNGRPCRACLQKGADCTHKGTDEPRTLPQALREIEKLQRRVKDLEFELEGYRSNRVSIPTPAPTSSKSSPDSWRRTGQDSSSSSPPDSPNYQWEGIQVATARSDQTSYYGPSSGVYFVSRIGSYLSTMFGVLCADRSIQPRGASRNVAIASANESNERDNDAALAGDGLSPMNRTQEEYFLNLFWEWSHCFLPVVDETWLRAHYASLWETGSAYRKNSPLVDIILALCLQHGYTFMSRDTSNASGQNDATIAGRWYYRRSQSLLTADLESPTIISVQCHIFTVIYLCAASFANMCHVVLAQAIRTAHILGLHLEPSSDLPRGERELRKRIWWVLYTSELKSAAKLGRPTMIQPSQFTVSFPSDDIETASYNGATLGSYDLDVTWLTYTIQHEKLVLSMHEVTEATYPKFGEVSSRHANGSLYQDPQGLESCAEVLASKLPSLRAWIAQLPPGMKTLRRNGGEPFSTDRSPLVIEDLAPVWLQRQRVCLELMYHTFTLNLCRPFISFTSHTTTYAPISERHAMTAVNHAIAYTLITHQVTTETDLFSGWSEYFMWQWNAAITIIGFILANPIHPSNPKARQALELAIAIFDGYGVNFPVAASAAKIMRALLGKADLLAERLRTGVALSCDANKCLDDGQGGGGEDELGWLDSSQQNDPNYFSQFMDWALSVDSFNSFEKFFDASNPADPWAFGQQ
ncbi:unnamed protein product [Clonostachys rosea f. rosea IK726]|uniref:Uncharacterized protein n=1 Tax=Clonostachys rosea f. rosea IK726 TaxID=1349383 RepID=A0ACA9USR0_BIOOC|nr:unnamed protein product [Clonostachys rosea f. rosea IK726]